MPNTRPKIPKKFSHSSQRKTPRLSGHRLPRKVHPRWVLAGSDGEHDLLVSLGQATREQLLRCYLFIAENGDALYVPENMLDHARHMPDRVWCEEINLHDLLRIVARS